MIKILRSLTGRPAKDHSLLHAAQWGASLGAAFDAFVGETLAGLPDPLRVVVTLVDVDGLSYAAAAGVLDLEVETLTRRLHQGRTRIRRQLISAGLARASR
jgi:DNA-directed RNA polymerase specialized sigma24 family protein